VVNIIFGGSSAPSCKRSIKLHNRDVNSVFRHPVEPLRWSEIPITFDRRDHWVHLPRPGAYPLVVNPVIRQIRLARVLVDGGNTLNIIFAKTLEDMGFDMTKLVPSDQAFYGIIPSAGSTPVGKVTLPRHLRHPGQLPHGVHHLRGGPVRDFLPRYTRETSSRQFHGDSQPHISSLEDAGSKWSPFHPRRHPNISLL